MGERQRNLSSRLEGDDVQNPPVATIDTESVFRSFRRGTPTGTTGRPVWGPVIRRNLAVICNRGAESEDLALDGIGIGIRAHVDTRWLVLRDGQEVIAVPVAAEVGWPYRNQEMPGWESGRLN